MNRHFFQVYRDTIESCPMIYTRLLHHIRISTDIYKIMENQGLLLRKWEKNHDSTRKQVYVVYATPEGKEFVECVNRAEELIGIR